MTAIFGDFSGYFIRPAAIFYGDMLPFVLSACD